MLCIKVRTSIAGHDGWSLFEAEGPAIHWDNERKTKTADELLHLTNIDRDAFLSFDIGYFKDDSLPGNDWKILCKEIRYKKHDEEGFWQVLLFHDVCYIINENGKTIETIRV